ncbi:hypothetical protein HDK64DRAFT_331114 [Phyllosticta capitalensis]
MPSLSTAARGSGNDPDHPYNRKWDNKSSSELLVVRILLPYDSLTMFRLVDHWTGLCLRCERKVHDDGWRNCTRQCIHCNSTTSHVGDFCPKKGREWFKRHGGRIVGPTRPTGSTSAASRTDDQEYRRHRAAQHKSEDRSGSSTRRRSRSPLRHRDNSRFRERGRGDRPPLRQARQRSLSPRRDGSTRRQHDNNSPAPPSENAALPHSLPAPPADTPPVGTPNNAQIWQIVCQLAVALKNENDAMRSRIIRLEEEAGASRIRLAGLEEQVTRLRTRESEGMAGVAVRGPDEGLVPTSRSPPSDPRRRNRPRTESSPPRHMW